MSHRVTFVCSGRHAPSLHEHCGPIKQQFLPVEVVILGDPLNPPHPQTPLVSAVHPNATQRHWRELAWEQQYPCAFASALHAMSDDELLLSGLQMQVASAV